MEAFDKFGPITVGIDANGAFGYYESGIYAVNAGACSQNISNEISNLKLIISLIRLLNRSCCFIDCLWCRFTWKKILDHLEPMGNKVGKWRFVFVNLDKKKLVLRLS